VTFDDVVKVALVGTARSGGAGSGQPLLGGALGEAMASVKPDGAEAKLLSDAALLAAYEACGRVPAVAPAKPAPASADVMPTCSPRAADLLGTLLAMTNAPTKRRLVAEWLDHAAQARQRVPHAWLPQLLEYGASVVTLRSQIARAVDARGHWLMGLNPRWHYGIGEVDDPRQAWATGTAAARAAAIRRLRDSDPGAARELVASTWAEDGADERTAFVEAMATGLSLADEPFLEAALDDRSRPVRAAAAERLARLPQSGFTTRMRARAEAIVRIIPAAKGGLLKRGKPAAIEVSLPAKLDPAWQRDGIVEKPADRIGQKQWWAQQVIAHVPPAHWSALWQMDPSHCIAAAAGDHRDLLLRAWTEASGRHPDAKWAGALLLTKSRGDRDPLPVQLLNGLPSPAQLALATALLEAPGLSFDQVSQVIGAADFPFDRHLTHAALAQLDRHAAATKGRYDYGLQPLLDGIALRVPPTMYDELSTRWSGAFWDANRRAVDGSLATLLIRRDIQREFAT
jgi:hypothetical protein